MGKRERLGEVVKTGDVRKKRLREEVQTDEGEERKIGRSSKDRRC